MKIITQLKKYLRPLYVPLYYAYIDHVKDKYVKEKVHEFKNIIIEKDIQYVYYFGIASHSNMGDMAQYYCIKKWIHENYPKAMLLEFESEVIVFKKRKFIFYLKQKMKNDDIVIFQSGYTTQDLGGVHDLMHRIVIDNLPDAHILMMPQTIFFKKEINKLKTSESYNKAKRMLFLARDKVSYETAMEMFPSVTVKLFPDIVTSLIGKYHFDNKRKGVMFCCRNDNEKLYSNIKLLELKYKIQNFESVDSSDTTIDENYKFIRDNIKFYIDREIMKFSKYKVVITDRYHGTIFSLIAGTPVIVLKTNDHKVITGVDWFRGVYDEYVYLADNLEHAFTLFKQLNKQESRGNNLNSHFNDNYYLKLNHYFENV